MHLLPSLFPEDGHFGHLLVSLITLGIGIALSVTFSHSNSLSFFIYLLLFHRLHWMLLSLAQFQMRHIWFIFQVFYDICSCFWSEALPFHHVNGPFLTQHSKPSPSPYHFIQTSPEILQVAFAFIAKSKQNWTKTICIHPAHTCTQ